MDGFGRIPDIPDADWEKMAEEQQQAYNRRVDATNEYYQKKDPGLPILLLCRNHSENSDALGGFAPARSWHPPIAITSQKPAI